MRIIEKKARYFDGEMSGVDAAIAEITITNGERTFYLYGEWTSEAGDDILFCASTDSLYDLEIRVPEADEEEMKEIERMRECYSSSVEPDMVETFRGMYIHVLKGMLIDICAENGVHPF